MAQFLTSQKLKTYEQLFAQLDYFSTGNLQSHKKVTQVQDKGRIAPQQLYSVLRSMHIRLSLDQIIELINQTGNTEENRAVSLSEFLAIISIVIQDKDFNEQIYEVFKVFDVDKNKVIDFKDFQMGFQKMDVEISKDDLLTMLQATGKSQFTLKQFRQFVLDK